MFRRIALALGFLTILPVKLRGTVTEIDKARSMIWYPAIGLLIGAILAGIHTAALELLSPTVTALAVLITYCFLTGSIHLDGIADTADGLFSGPKNKTAILNIMRDSHIGAMGVIALIVTLLSKVLLISSLAPDVCAQALILACSTSRFVAVMAAFVMPYARTGEGLAKPYCEYLRFRDAFAALLVYSGALLFVHIPKLVLIYSLVFIFTALLLRYFKARVGGLTGDLLGSLIESVEILTLFLIILLSRVSF